jgi:C-terminal processing protease CtpA/Prc
MTPPLRTIATLALLAAALPALAAQARLGFGVEAKTSGFLSPVLEQVTVARVAPGSPAARAGLHTGDRIVAIDGHLVKGAAARPMSARLQGLAAGQHVRLGVERPGGRVEFDLVAEVLP